MISFRLTSVILFETVFCEYQKLNREIKQARLVNIVLDAVNNIIIIMIFYCGLVVHITDTRTQKVVSYASAHITERSEPMNQTNCCI